MSRQTPTLESRAEPVGTAFDLLAAYRPPGVFFERRGVGVAGWLGGATLTFGSEDLAGLSGVVDLLRTADAGPDAASVAAGAIAFGSDRRPHELVVPRRSVRRDPDGRAWRFDTTVLGEPGEDPPSFDRVAGGAPHEPFRDVQITETPTSDGYVRAVTSAVDALRETELRKVVLARTVEVDAGRTLDPRALVHRLRAADPDAYTFAAPTNEGVIVGASPELLVSRHDREMRSNPLAGSAARSGDLEEDRTNAEALASSAKEREEHAIVVEAVAETLQPFCDTLTWDPEPVLRETPNVWHLSTSFRGILREPAPTALDLVAALHPTPAVAGTPTETALAVIEELEPFDRGRYAGPVGWVDANGNGEWAIALRCAELLGDRAVLFAGAGIVAGSDASAELEETARKFRAFLDSLRWG